MICESKIYDELPNVQDSCPKVSKAYLEPAPEKVTESKIQTCHF